MRRVLVPLDGSPFAESILPDAIQFAGPDGELILVREITSTAYYNFSLSHRWPGTIETLEYLEEKAELLRAEGVAAQGHVLRFHGVPLAIDEAARIFKADMIACATHGRGPFGRFVNGAAAWKAVAYSELPVLLRHPQADNSLRAHREKAREVLVPLDGSEYAEKALPFAQALAAEWNVPLLLVRVVPDLPLEPVPFGPVVPFDYDAEAEVEAARAYIDQIAKQVGSDVRGIVRRGNAVNSLAQLVEGSSVSHVVMASHGRTGLSRAIVGSVADSLIHKLHCPMVVIPALACEKVAPPDLKKAQIPSVPVQASPLPGGE
jgi:nucleotide-binding universal stress UspA family protein